MMSDTLLRQLKMLELVPRTPRKTTLAELEQRLHERGFTSTRRTLERDILQLSRIFPLVGDEHKPRGWCWTSEAKALELPAMDVRTALTFGMIERFLANLLPRSTYDSLQQHFDRAREILRQASHNGMNSWMDKVAVVPPGLPLLAPKLDPEVMGILSEGLLQEQQVKISYLKRGATEPQSYQISPLGLVWFGHLNYLVGAFPGRDYVVRLPVNRISTAELTEQPLEWPEPYTGLQDYLDSGVFNYRSSDRTLKLKLRTDADTAAHLQEVRLSEQQVIHSEGNSWLVEAEVRDLQQLRWWLRGYGSSVEVLEPEFLREELRQEARRVLALYQPEFP